MKTMIFKGTAAGFKQRRMALNCASGTAPAERDGDGAFARAVRKRLIRRFCPHESGAEATALQTLARRLSAIGLAKRLECGVVTAAVARALRQPEIEILRAHESGVAASSIFCFRGRGRLNFGPDTRQCNAVSRLCVSFSCA